MSQSELTYDTSKIRKNATMIDKPQLEPRLKAWKKSSPGRGPSKPSFMASHSFPGLQLPCLGLTRLAASGWAFNITNLPIWSHQIVYLIWSIHLSISSCLQSGCSWVPITTGENSYHLYWYISPFPTKTLVTLERLGAAFCEFVHILCSYNRTKSKKKNPKKWVNTHTYIDISAHFLPKLL